MPRIPGRTDQVSPTNRQSWPREQTGTRQGNQTQENARAQTAAARGCPFLDGNLIPAVKFATGGGVMLDHKLGRPYRGFFLMYPRAYVSGAIEVAESAAANALPNLHIVLGSLGTFTADVWVY